MNKVKIDYIKNIEIDLDNPPISNIQALNYLESGIFYLVNAVGSMEIKSNNPESTINENEFIPGNSTQFYWSNSNPHHNLILNQFNWFVISCVSYIKTIGLIDIMIQKG